MNKKEKDELTPEEKERLAKVFITLIEKLEKWNLALRAQEGYRNLGIQSEPPTLTVEDVDRFFRLMFDGEKAELSTPGAYLLVQLTQGRRSPFPFMSQTRSVQEAIIRVLMYNHEVKKVLLDMAFGGE